MSKIVLTCVKEKSKLRIKFHSFTDSEGKVYSNVYDNSLNCMFPKDIRVEGRFYEIDEDELELVSRRGAKPFYRVSAGRIRIIDASAAPNAPASATTVEKVFEIAECVVCMCEDSSEILVPCGHKCMCRACALQIFKTSHKCPICRKQIVSLVSQNE